MSTRKQDSAGVSRRSFLTGALKLGATFGISQFLPEFALPVLGETIPGKEKLLVRSVRPTDLETPVELLNSFITPIDLFYVRSHLYTPEVELEDWSLSVGGMVGTPLSLKLDDLKKLPRKTVTVTLECAGNGRAFFDPPVAGIQWGKGAVGTARWTGVSLADVLKKAGLKSGVKYITANGADRPMGKVPDMVRNVPLEKALHPDTVLAWEMNGQPIPALHGFPLRLIVPGWEAAYSVKWLIDLQAADAEYDGFFVKTAYRFPKKPVAPGTILDPKDTAPLLGLVVKSIITTPKHGLKVKVGEKVMVSGFAWAGESDIVKVDVSTDRGSTWRPARLGKEHERYAWRQFFYEWTAPESGSHTILSRATDDKGRTQPVTAQWNQSGYLWNVIDQVRINAE
ncbi:MAG: sulfite oxidase [Blastocatellia bacterium]|nr:sulfite oxidase [Blastocatellia bacterium]